MRWIAISKKTGKELFRDRMALFFILMFPLIFILIFGAAFGTFTGENTTFYIAVINLDEGVELNNTSINHGDELLEIYKSMKYQDNEGGNTSTKVFDIRTDLDEAEAQELVEDQDLIAYIIIPKNFSSAVLAESMRYVKSAVAVSIQEQFDDIIMNIDLSDPNAILDITSQFMASFIGGEGDISDIIPSYDENATAAVIIQGDPGISSYYTVSSIVESVLDEYIEQAGLIALEYSKDYFP